MVDVFFWVQHLLGTGHLARAAAIVRALRRAGHTVTLASGGLPVPALELSGAELLQLEPLQSDAGNFSLLLDAVGRPVDEAFRQRRAAALVAAFTARRPRVLMLEMFPFGRRQMRFELEPLLAAAEAMRPRPALVSSVRDILVPSTKPGRVEEILERASRLDAVLVHGDPELVPFSATFPAAARLGARLVETGYVVDPPPVAAAGRDGTGEIIVSAGGGRVGEHLIETAITASELMRGGPAWRVLAGWHLPEAHFATLAAQTRPGLVIERARPDFRELLGRAALSISQGGYNTALEVLVAGCRSIMVPFAAGGESEQALRCRLLAERGLVRVLSEEGLTPAGLADAVRCALAAPPPSGAAPRSDGADVTVRLLRRLALATNTRDLS